MNSTEERTRVVKAASKIILTDIRSKVYDIENYPAADNFLGGVDSDIPETLKLLLNEIILKGKKGNTDGWDKKLLLCRTASSVQQDLSHSCRHCKSVFRHFFTKNSPLAA